MTRLPAILALAAVACSGREPHPSASPARRVAAGTGWNVLLITIDTLRADHLGAYGYARPTSPHIDALAGRGTTFDQAYTYWPKTRGSMVMMFTGRTPSQNGYAKSHPVLLDFNPTIAGVLKQAGYSTRAAVDNPNVAAQHGYAKGFDSFRETWEAKSLLSEMDRARAITAEASRVLSQRHERPFFLWLHYVNPHAPYTPPPPFDAVFLDRASDSGPRLPVVPGLHGGIPQQWAVTGRDRLGYYVAQYDGEIAAADREVGQVLLALQASGAAEQTLILLTSDHGESLGEHDYYFDHGENLFDPGLRIPLIVKVPGGAGGGRSDTLASTLDVLPTILDALKVSYPPDLAGRSLLAAAQGGAAPERAALVAQNERNLLSNFAARFKLVATPDAERIRYALYDRQADPGETRDASRLRPAELRRHQRELERFHEQAAREWSLTRRLIGDQSSARRMSAAACEKLQALGYVVAECQS